MQEPREQLKEDFFVSTTKAIAKLGTCLRAKVGCLIVRDNRIIATGYNGSPPGYPHCTDIGCLMQEGHCVRTIHAEANAIAFAARYGISTQGATLYSYGWQGGVCPTCAKLARSAGINVTVQIPLENKEPIIDVGTPKKVSVHNCEQAGCQIEK